MRYNDCYCPHYDDSMRLFTSALNDVLTERYLIFRKQKTFLFWDYIEEINVHIPKDYQPDYNQKAIEFKMRCVELIDQGYKNEYITEELLERGRMQIADYLISKNIVWE